MTSELISRLYTGKPWPTKFYGDGSVTVDGAETSTLLDPHPDFTVTDESGGEHSIGTSLFVGPKLPRYGFHEDLPLYCPESVKWNRMLYYSMGNPRLFDALPEELQERVMETLRVFHDGVCLFPIYPIPEEGPYKVEPIGREEVDLEGVPGVWSLWGKCTPKGPLRCLDVHECVSLGYEMRMHHYMLEEARQYVHSDDYFYLGNEQREPVKMFGKSYDADKTFSLERRSKAISNWYGLQVRLVATHLGGQPGDKFLRELVEAQFAWEWKAIYWNRSYFQAVTQRMVKGQLQAENVMKKV